jgi:hypothetical protein
MCVGVLSMCPALNVEMFHVFFETLCACRATVHILPLKEIDVWHEGVRGSGGEGARILNLCTG